ncbi:hypothetical protein Patl1_29734 [Pistacia atlantica]|uniref:Uncharacterized protein n=1 Tax=Pistacia atlantica TaxID=434234 RepID=A0ACC1ADN7_9ROSI|nr:hypothetical protein Patl1_29734 [Pistacia atlantica]
MGTLRQTGQWPRLVYAMAICLISQNVVAYAPYTYSSPSPPHYSKQVYKPKHYNYVSPLLPKHSPLPPKKLEHPSYQYKSSPPPKHIEQPSYYHKSPPPPKHSSPPTYYYKLPPPLVKSSPSYYYKSPPPPSPSPPSPYVYKSPSPPSSSPSPPYIYKSPPPPSHSPPPPYIYKSPTPPKHVEHPPYHYKLQVPQVSCSNRNLTSYANICNLDSTNKTQCLQHSDSGIPATNAVVFDINVTKADNFDFTTSVNIYVSDNALDIVDDSDMNKSDLGSALHIASMFDVVAIDYTRNIDISHIDNFSTAIDSTRNKSDSGSALHTTSMFDVAIIDSTRNINISHIDNFATAMDYTRNKFDPGSTLHTASVFDVAAIDSTENIYISYIDNFTTANSKITKTLYHNSAIEKSETNTLNSVDFLDHDKCSKSLVANHTVFHASNTRNNTISL